MNEKRHTGEKGFTLAELLVVVAIMAVVAAIAIPSIIHYQHKLEAAECDSQAKLIYIAAQNNITDLNTTGQWTIDESLYKPTGQNVTVPLSDASPGTDMNLSHYFHIDAVAARTDGILPSFTVDESVRQGNYIIEYNYNTGMVYGVYYTKNGSQDDLNTFYAAGAGNRDLTTIHDNRPIVGYYGGAGADELGFQTLATPVVTSSSDTISVKDGNLATHGPGSTENWNTSITLTIKGETSGAVATFVMKATGPTTASLLFLSPTGYKDVTSEGIVSLAADGTYTLSTTAIAASSNDYLRALTFTESEQVALTAKCSSSTVLSRSTYGYGYATWAVDAEARIGSTYYRKLYQAFDDAKANQTIVLLRDVVIDGSDRLPCTATVAGLTFTGANSTGTPYSVTRAASGTTPYTGALITVDSGASLSTHDVTLDGSKATITAVKPLVDIASGASYTVDTDTVLRNNWNATSVWGSGIGGGAINCAGGTLTVNAGTITGNICLNTANTTWSMGGGIYVGPGSDFSMTGGTISGNYAGADYATTLTAADGTGYTNRSGYGGGIAVLNADSFTFDGDALITDNHAAGSGGGIGFVSSDVSNYTLSGGFISRNTCLGWASSSTDAGYGGGIGCTNTNAKRITVTIDGTDVVGNVAKRGGGLGGWGSYVTLALSDGFITGNTLDASYGVEGAGVGIGASVAGAEFRMSGGVVGGVFTDTVSEPGVTTTYEGNDAGVDSGGGIAGISRAALLFTGGSVTGNTAASMAGVEFGTNMSLSLEGDTFIEDNFDTAGYADNLEFSGGNTANITLTDTLTGHVGLSYDGATMGRHAGGNAFATASDPGTATASSTAFEDDLSSLLITTSGNNVIWDTTICRNANTGTLYTSLQSAMNAASSGQILEMLVGNYSVSTTQTLQSKNLTITTAAEVGYPCTISNSASGIDLFTIKGASTLTLDEVELANGAAMGRAIYIANHNGGVVLDNADITGFTMTYNGVGSKTRGGAIWSAGIGHVVMSGTSTISDCSIDPNGTRGDGRGGAIYLQNGDLTMLDDSRITGCVALGGAAVSIGGANTGSALSMSGNASIDNCRTPYTSGSIGSVLMLAAANLSLSDNAGIHDNVGGKYLIDMSTAKTLTFRSTVSFADDSYCTDNSFTGTTPADASLIGSQQTTASSSSANNLFDVRLADNATIARNDVGIGSIIRLRDDGLSGAQAHSLIMTGGSIIDNVAEKGAVYVGEGTGISCVVSGPSVITNNAMSDTPGALQANVYIVGDQNLTVGTGGFNTGASIGVSFEDTTRAAAGAVFGTTAATSSATVPGLSLITCDDNTALVATAGTGNRIVWS